MSLDVLTLERNLEVSDQINWLIIRFHQYRGVDIHVRPEAMLRRIKGFLGEFSQERHEYFKDTLLSGSSCLTLAVEAASLAARQEIPVDIVRPKDIGHYLHAALLYNQNDELRVFKVSGRDYQPDYVILGIDSIEQRLKFFKPIIDFVNHRKHLY